MTSEMVDSIVSAVDWTLLVAALMSVLALWASVVVVVQGGKLILMAIGKPGGALERPSDDASDEEWNAYWDARNEAEVSCSMCGGPHSSDDHPI